MPTTKVESGSSSVARPVGAAAPPEPKYQLTFVESPNVLISILRGIQDRLRTPKITVPPQYYRGEAPLPVVEMQPWYRDLHNQIKILFEPPRDPISTYNRRQEKRRALVAALTACAAAGAGWWIQTETGLAVGAIGGYAFGWAVGIILFKKMDYPPDIWQDYRPQSASWVNSVLVHALGLVAILLPFYLAQMMKPIKVSGKVEIVDISPYLADLAPSEKKAGGGGGGGDRSRTPASKGAVPKFAKQQLAPPMVKTPNLAPLMPVQPNLLGPPDLKLPQMAANLSLGNPPSVISAASNGPGFGGGMGEGEGTGIGSGRGGGLGPGEGGGTGGGPFSVGGNVSEPICIYKPLPGYSEEARKAKYQGTVVLWIVVDAQGNVTDLRVVKPLGLGLDEKAIETVHTWKFKPALRNGSPVAVRMSVEVSFRLF